MNPKLRQVKSKDGFYEFRYVGGTVKERNRLNARIKQEVDIEAQADTIAFGKGI